MYKGIIFFDLDGTLLNEYSVISEENKIILKELQEKGYLCVIASGRSPQEILGITQGVNISSYISLNGQYIVVNHQVLIKHKMDLKVIQELDNFSRKLNNSLAYYGEKEYKINLIDQAAIQLYAMDHAPLPSIEPEFYKYNDIYMLYLFNSDKELDVLYEKEFAGNLTFYRDSPYSMAIVNQGNSKKNGIKELYKALEFTNYEETYAFGDGNNDVSMFEVVKHGIAMGNANELVKEKAEFITKSHTTNGILFALQKYQLL
ncbi:HAD family hydrolase [Bacillus sp. Au-Bac7]|uniref:HAD family hydrolase n=1 Tax=Bacillus sp. Au-Bac7 TaxID=2906458 RepID=UPI001E51785B|nr:HAD family hydrolase [Bacillus sp. Au-Bac7]MCE4052127.1 HAD family hydrolase [Bacillus sp. Au-Bac7]